METIGPIVAMAVRPAARQAMHEVTRAAVATDGSLDGDHGDGGRRGITLLSARQWREVTNELGADLPWQTRRANILVDCDRLGHLIGHTIRVGAVTVRIHAETTPCAIMNEFHPGLQAALAPDCRAGVYGQVLDGGDIAVGDTVALED